MLVAWADPSHRHMRESAIIIDGRILALFTGPLTEDALSKGRTFALVLQDPRCAAEALEAFNADWERRAFLPHTAAVAFSPEKARAAIHDLLRIRNPSVSVYTESIADDEIEDLLGEAAKGGAYVRILVSDSSAAGMPGIIRLRQQGCLVEIQPTPRIYGSAIIVGTKNQASAAFVGSQALSTQSLDEDRELGAPVTDARRLARLLRAFDKDWAGFRK